MDIRTTSILISRLREDADLLKRIIKKEADDARLLLDYEVHKEMSEEIMKVGTDLATAEVLFRKFGRASFGAKKVQVC